MNLKDIEFKDHRKVWRSEKFLREYFVIRKHEDPFKNIYVRNFLTQLNRIEVKKEYTLAGYGSLLNKNDVLRTLPSAKNHRLSHIDGYRRIFNVGWDTAYLNIEENADSLINVALIDFPYYELPNIITREGWYSFNEVKTINDQQVLVVIGDAGCIKDTIDPQLNYIHLCLSGAKDLGGLKEIANFLDQTYCYSQEKAKHVTLREYLNNLNVVNHMIQNEYSSR